MGNSDDHILLGDHVLDGEIALLRHDFRPALVTVYILHLEQLRSDDLQLPFRAFKDKAEFIDKSESFLVLGIDFLAFHTGKALETHLEDGLGLHLGELEALHKPVLRGIGIG